MATEMTEQQNRSDLFVTAERLLSALAAVRNAYITATHDHPDDDERSLLLGYSEHAIHAARVVLYGEEG